MYRWFEQVRTEDAVNAMHRLAVEHGVPRGELAESDNTKRLVLLATGALAAFCCGLLGLWVLAAGPDPGFNLIAGPSMLFMAVVAGAGAWWSAREDASLEVFAHLTEAHDLVQVQAPALTRDLAGVLPFVVTEELVTDQQLCTHVYLVGEYEGRRIAYVECDHVIDPMAGNAFMRNTGLLRINQMQRLALRGMDAVVLLDRVDLPDLIVVPRNDAAIGMYEAAMEGSPELQLPNGLDAYWFARSSEPVPGLFEGPLGGFLAEMEWCILQVIGGHAVFIGSHRGKNVFVPTHRPAGTIEENLALAGEFFAMLGTDVVAERSAESGGETIAPESTPKPRQQAAREGGAWWALGARVVSGGVGLLSLFLAFTVLLVTVPEMMAVNSGSWPSVPGQVTSFDVSQSGSRFRPKLEYTYVVNGKTYKNDRIQAGYTSTRNQGDIEQLRSTYPVGKSVTVHHHPSWPSMATLQTGEHPESTRTGGLVCLVCLVPTGFLFIGVALFWKP